MKRLPRHLRTTRDDYGLEGWPTNALCDRERYFKACERAVQDLQALSQDDEVPHDEVVKMLAIFVHKDEAFATYVRAHGQGALDLADTDAWAQIDETASWLIYIAWLGSQDGADG